MAGPNVCTNVCDEVNGVRRSREAMVLPVALTIQPWQEKQKGEWGMYHFYNYKLLVLLRSSMLRQAKTQKAMFSTE